VSYSDENVFGMKLKPTSGDISLESLLLKTPSLVEFWKPYVKIPNDSSDHHLIK
jgi:hypothetical protein